MRLAILAICALLAPLPGPAQEAPSQQAWLQIAAERNEARARAVAERFAGALPGLALIELGSTWIAVAAGPLPKADAEALWRDLRAAGAIPQDSYLSDGARFGEVIWQAGTPLPVPGTAEAGALDAARLREAQRALAFDARYAGPLDGRMTAETRAAIAGWQADEGYAQTGILDAAALDRLLGPMRAAEAAMGFERIEDGVTGIAVDIPAALVAFDRYEAPYAHFAPQGESGVALRLISMPGDAGMLDTLYAALQEDPEVPGTGFRELGAESFVLTGTNDQRRAYGWAEARDGAVKGFLLLWPGGDAAGLDLTARDRAVSRMRAGFAAEPTQVMALPPATIPLAAPAPEPAAWRRAGVAVSADGAVLSLAEGLEACGRITLGTGRAARLVESDGTLALLQPAEPAGAALPATLLDRPVAAGTAVTLAGFGQGSDQGGGSVRATPVPALVSGSDGAMLALSADLLLEGDAGGPVLTDRGALAGLVLPGAPPRALPAPALRAFLADAGVLLADAAPEAPLLSPVVQAQRAAMLTVAVTCWP